LKYSLIKVYINYILQIFYCIKRIVGQVIFGDWVDGRFDFELVWLEGMRNNQKLMFLLYNFVRAGARGWKDA